MKTIPFWERQHLVTQQQLSHCRRKRLRVRFPFGHLHNDCRSHRNISNINRFDFHLSSNRGVVSPGVSPPPCLGLGWGEGLIPRGPWPCLGVPGLPWLPGLLAHIWAALTQSMPALLGPARGVGDECWGVLPPAGIEGIFIVTFPFQHTYSRKHSGSILRKACVACET